MYTHPVSKRKFHIMRFTDEAKAYLLELDKQLDERSINHDKSAIERAICKRAVEQICRVSFILGLGCITLPGFCGLIGMDCVKMGRARRKGQASISLRLR